MIEAPWTRDQVVNLQKRQQAYSLHAYTCGKCGSRLFPASAGWICSTDGCGYTQTWAHDIDLDGGFKAVVAFPALLRREWR